MQVRSVERKELEIFTGKGWDSLSYLVNGSSKKCNVVVVFSVSLCGVLLYIKLNKSMILKT